MLVCAILLARIVPLIYNLTFTCVYTHGTVVYHTRISYCTRMVHTVRVYAYGTTVRVWYGYLYHMRIAVLYCYCLQATYI